MFEELLNLRTLSLTSRVSNHHGYLSNFAKIIIYTSKYILYCTTTMVSPNEDSLHAPKPNDNHNDIYIWKICVYNIQGGW